ncbi:MAG: type II toxin-antitoxin system VapC family toxin [Myxococcales bacterium]|nr:type II toxin-antitoxin system VapC family toxin [Myxococcales bacterium]
MIALLDAHVLLWWFEQPKKLSVPQRRLLRKASDTSSLGVSDVTLWEVALLVERGRVELAMPLDRWLASATAAPLVERVGISPVIVQEMVSLGATRAWDPADRILVATARVLGVPLVTSDARIEDSGLVQVVS